jgi:hypothetical protein
MSKNGVILINKLTSFLEQFILTRKGALRGPEWSKSSKFGHLLLVVHLSCKNNKQTTHKDAQNHFGQLAERSQTVAKSF